MKHIILPTFEWFPVTPGGAGVFVAAAAELLARAGHRVTALCDLSIGDVQRARSELQRTARGPGALQVIGVSEFVEDGQFVPGAGLTYFDVKGLRFAHALAKLHAREPIDLVEFPEYGGPAAATLEQRAAGAFPQLKIAVRLHGGFAFIDEAEGVTPGEERRRMYEAEARALTLADVILAPSKAIGRLYQERYGFEVARLVTSPPPMELLLEGLEPPERFVDPAHFLFFGKLQEVKGCDTFARAASHLVERHPERRWRFSFVGPDTPCTHHGGWVSACIAKLLPANAPFEAFEFIPWVDRSSLPRLARRPVAGVIPSRFETFCLAAHELRAVGLPLIVPMIPGFEGWLDESTGCLRWDGSVEELADAMLRIRDDVAVQNRLEASPRPLYPPFAETYEKLFR